MKADQGDALAEHAAVCHPALKWMRLVTMNQSRFRGACLIVNDRRSRVAPNSGKAYWVADNVRRLFLGCRLMQTGLQSRYGNHPKNPLRFQSLYFVPKAGRISLNF
jgi:hypothetical protein